MQYQKLKLPLILAITSISFIFYSWSFHYNCEEPKKMAVNQIDYVPDSATAIKIAEAIWYAIYGPSIYQEKPYYAELKNNIWIVRSSMGDVLGGSAYIEIQKSDCKILKVTHGM